MRQFAISDIHGHLFTFRALLKQLKFTVDDELFLLGDFIDRGPDSKGVIDEIECLKQLGYRVHCLRGNHEQMCLDAPLDRDSWRMWIANGGPATCASFGTTDFTIPQDYLDWMADLPFHLETEGYLFVHAGVNTRLANPLQDHESLLWARRWAHDLDLGWLNNRIVVHGHTPTPQDEIEMGVIAVDALPVINIDAGCFAKNRKGMGHLCALELGTHALVFQENVG